MGVQITINMPYDGQVVTGTAYVAGWAVDDASPPGRGTGVDRVEIYLDSIATPGAILNGVTYGQSRNDVSSVTRPDWDPSGWFLYWNTDLVARGPHTLYVYAHSTITNEWRAATVRVVVGPAYCSATSQPATLNGGRLYEGTGRIPLVWDPPGVLREDPCEGGVRVLSVGDVVVANAERYVWQGGSTFAPERSLPAPTQPPATQPPGTAPPAFGRPTQPGPAPSRPLGDVLDWARANPLPAAAVVGGVYLVFLRGRRL